MEYLIAFKSSTFVGIVLVEDGIDGLSELFVGRFPTHLYFFNNT